MASDTKKLPRRTTKSLVFTEAGEEKGKIRSDCRGKNSAGSPMRLPHRKRELKERRVSEVREKKQNAFKRIAEWAHQYSSHINI